MPADGWIDLPDVAADVELDSVVLAAVDGRGALTTGPSTRSPPDVSPRTVGCLIALTRKRPGARRRRAQR